MLETGSRYAVIALAAGVAVVATMSLLRAAPGRGHGRWILTLPGIALVAGEAAHAAALLRERQEDPRRDLFADLFVWRAVGAVLLAAGLAGVLAVQLRRRRILARLAADLRAAPAPGKLRESLATAIGDPSLEIGYWLEAEAQLGAAARLAIENERLQTELLVRLEELAALRTRVLERGDEERRRLERNLHDGAQQRLLALSFELRFAAAQAPALAAAVDDAQAALAELRELASGIHPAILTDAGLGPALESLADMAPIPLLIQNVPDTRLRPPIEVTAYLLVADQVDGRRSGEPTVLIEARDGNLEIEVADAREVAAHVADRVRALAGRLELAGGTLRAVLPLS